jgi:L-threonylcarbamoyladenylate synthase
VGLVATGEGLRALAEIKGRDPNKPVALLCDAAEQAFGLADSVPPLAKTLADLYWPGPLTLVLPSSGGTVGVRVPDHPVVRELLAAYGGPLYATSANLAGEPPPASLEEVDVRILEAVELVVMGETGRGEASAVVDLSGPEPRLLRPNAALTGEDLKRLVGAE